jgi:hypothetical protein
MLYKPKACMKYLLMNISILFLMFYGINYALSQVEVISQPEIIH